MKKIFLILLSVLMILTSFSCGKDQSPKADYLTTDFIAMDTFFTLKIGGLKEGASSDDIFEECRSLVEKTDVLLSAHRKDSEVYALNGSIDVLMDADPALSELITFSAELSRITGGAFDPSIGALTALWNVKGGGPVPTDDAIAAALALSGMDKFTVENGSIKKADPGTVLDLGGIGKGYVAQRLTDHLVEAGASFGIVSAGRTIGVFGKKPDGTKFRIGIADPFNEGSVVGYLNIDGGFVAVAGDYENYFTENGIRYHHILDPETGRPSDSGLSSVAVFSGNGAAADALSTALMVMGYDKSMELYRSGSISFEAVFVTSDGGILVTDGLSEGIFEMSDTDRTVISDTTVSENNSDTTDTDTVVPDTTVTDTTVLITAE